VSIASHRLGLYGITDVVELHPTDNGDNSIRHPKYQGLWQPYPVEYKHGRPKRNEVDEVQLAAQAMCLEEQYGINIPYGAFFYAEIRQRVEVSINDQLRSIVCDCAEKMHEVFQSGQLPPITKGKYCDKCSLKDICLPQMAGCAKVSNYLDKYLYEETA
jgi:CRISPR-associated exonuclease Cas4